MSSTPHHADTPTDRSRNRRLPGTRGVGVAALAVTSGLLLAACTAGEEPVAAPSAEPSSVTSSSSSSPAQSMSTPPAPAVDPGPVVAPSAALVATHAPTAAPTASELPALVVDTGGPCHTIGEVAQALDGSPLFCLNDPDAGPLWLPQPESGPDATVPALRDEPCAQEGLTVDAPDGTPLTCTLIGDASMPGGLVWQ